MSHSLASLPDTGHPPARAWTGIRYISSRKRVVACEKMTTTTTTKYSSYINVGSEGAEELGWQRNQTYRRCIQPPSTQQKSGTRNPSFILILLVSSSTTLHLFPRSRRCMEEPTNRPCHPTKTRKKQACPASQSQTFRKCNGTQVQGRPRAQSRPGARATEHNRAQLSHANTNEQSPAWPGGVVAAALACSEEVHHATHNFKRESKKSGPGAGNPGCILGFVIKTSGRGAFAAMCAVVARVGTLVMQEGARIE